MSEDYEYWPNPGNFNFDGTSKPEEGNCPACGESRLLSGPCGDMDSGGLTKCTACGWNTDRTCWTEGEMNRLRAENQRLREAVEHLSMGLCNFHCPPCGECERCVDTGRVLRKLQEEGNEQ